jgi:uncharacterized protein (UPF0264 family)
MSLMLASVSSLAEARLVQKYDADIIDLKQPEQGALGALATHTVTEIVSALKPGSRISATVGDLPMRREPVCQAVADMAATGVDFIKIGFFPGDDSLGCIAGLAEIAQQGYALIAVLFADASPDFSLLKSLADAGFQGVMLDTMHKKRGGLTSLLTRQELQAFVQTAKQYQLLTGLAGSLTAADIPALLPLKADYLGFRGALCVNSERTASLDEGQIGRIRSLLVA